MLTNPPPIFRKRHRLPTPRTTPSPVPPVGPMLVAAAYLRDFGTQLQLTFDRAVDLAGFVEGQMRMNDGEFEGRWYRAYSPTIVGTGVVMFELSEQDPWTGPGVFLSATGATGIVAVDNGATWAGATDVALPFP